MSKPNSVSFRAFYLATLGRRWAGILPLLLGFLVAGPLCAASDDRQGGGETALHTVTVRVRVRFAEPTGALAMAALGTVEDVVAVKIVARDPRWGTRVLPPTELVERPPGSHVWEGELKGVPVGLSLDFVAEAYNGASLVIFSDMISQSFAADGPHDLEFEMLFAIHCLC